MVVQKIIDTLADVYELPFFQMFGDFICGMAVVGVIWLVVSLIKNDKRIDELEQEIEEEQETDKEGE